MRYSSVCLGCISLCILGLLGSHSTVHAQVRADRSLPRASRVRTEGNRWVITEGTQRGTNLFHSFEAFSVPENDIASFQGIDSDVANIFARVTGSLQSDINGTIETLQSSGSISPANLFLLNPNGIVFGPNAALNIGGSFIATSADRFTFADGTQFSATNPQASPLLTISTPIGLQFGANPGPITNQSIVENVDSTGELLLDPFSTPEFVSPALGLRVFPGRTLALVGGPVNLAGGWLVAGSEPTAPGGRIELASMGANEFVGLTPSETNWHLEVAGAQALGDVRLSQGAIVNASGDNGGAIVVQGRNVRLADGSQLFSVTQGSGNGDSLVVNATDRITLSGLSDQGFNSLLYTETQGTGAAGDIQLSSGQLRVRDGAFVVSLSSNAGLGGDVTIAAAETVDVVGAAETVNVVILSSILSLADAGGAAGHVTISTGQLNIRDGGEVGSIASSTGRGGDVIVNASDTVNIIGISTLAGLEDEARGGNLLAQTQAEDEDAGDAGNLIVTTDRLLLQNGGQIASSTIGGGNAGRLTVRAREIELDGIAVDENGAPFLSSPEDGSLPYPSGLFSGAGPGSTGNGGRLRVRADRLTLSNGAVLQTNTFGSGNAGNITADIADLIEINGQAPEGLSPSGITAISGGFPGSGFREVPDATGSSGNIRLETDRLSVSDGAVIATSSINPEARGAGQLTIQARTIALTNGSQLNARTESGGRNSATIELQGLDLLTLQGGSQITTRAGLETGGGSGGAIRIQSDFIVAEPTGDNDIAADAGEGDGGDVDITANVIGLIQQDRPTTPQSGITASSEQGVSGTITINSPEVNPTQGLVALPANVVDVSRLIAQTCRSPNPTDQQSEFVITGRGGLPPSPSDSGSSNPVQIEWIPFPETISQLEETPHAEAPPPALSAPIVEAQGWRVDEHGNIVLVAQVSTADSHSTTPLVPTCNMP
jgi:filamentous hemagglutinin family protein